MQEFIEGYADKAAKNVIVDEEAVSKYRVRKLIPKEAFRLMSFTDEQFNRAEEVSSNTALYKACGNSIAVNCLVAVLGQMIEGREDYYKKIYDTPIKSVDNSVETVDNY